MKYQRRSQSGLTLVELLVAMAISLMIMAAAIYVYIASSDSQRVLDRNTASNETGVFAMQMLGRAIMNAGFYPAPSKPIPVDVTQTGMYDTYPPISATKRAVTDWANPEANWPPAAFQTGIYGCDGAKLKPSSSACDDAKDGAADTLVINYFTADAMGGASGSRFDCTGTDVAKDPSNLERNKSASGEAVVDGSPPRLPLFGSNRYTLQLSKAYIGRAEVETKSLVCSGNGKSPQGASDDDAYQSLLSGIEDMQFSYGVYSTEKTLNPDKFYTATEVNGLDRVNINGQMLTGWQRVVAVRACILTKTLQGKTRIGDAKGSEKTYLNCQGVTKQQPSGETYTRLVQVFGVRNGLKQSY
ncbi:PilW family protein [Delftia acidovorans]|uniref:PilW family protein n=1 Tax=Delftia acidovorans TaxID=80866 RepID=UPI003D142C61